MKELRNMSDQELRVTIRDCKNLLEMRAAQGTNHRVPKIEEPGHIEEAAAESED